MIKYKIGNLITAALAGEVDIILHQVNAQCVMKSGIAKAIVENFPSAKIADDKTFVNGLPTSHKLGTFSYTYERGVQIYNVCGQDQYGTDERKTNYGALAEGLVNAKQAILKLGDEHQKIGIPLIGCGLAGGSWTLVSEVVSHIFRDFDLTVYIIDEAHFPDEDCFGLTEFGKTRVSKHTHLQSDNAGSTKAVANLLSNETLKLLGGIPAGSMASLVVQPVPYNDNGISLLTQAVEPLVPAVQAALDNFYDGDGKLEETNSDLPAFKKIDPPTIPQKRPYNKRK